MARVGLNRASVIDAAVSLADREGLDGLTLARLAADLGVRSPSLYKHVEGLDDLRSAVAARAATELADGMAAATQGRSGHDAVRAMAYAVRDYALAHPRLYEATVLSHVHQPPGAREALAQSLRLLLHVFGTLGLTGEDAVFAARTYRSMVHGFVHLEASRGFGLAVDLDESFERMLDVLMRGLRSTS